MIPYVKTLPYILPSISTTIMETKRTSRRPLHRKAPYNYGWDWGPRFMTEGIWQPVRLETGMRCASITFTFINTALPPTLPTLRRSSISMLVRRRRPRLHWLTMNVRTATSDGTQTLQLNAGINHISFPLRIAAPKLWYPWDTGRRAATVFRFDPYRPRGRSSRRDENRTAFGRTSPCSRSMGKKL